MNTDKVVVRLSVFEHLIQSINDHFNRWVTLAKATANAWMAVNGYWKSNVYALLSIRPNCITCECAHALNLF